MNIVRFFQLSVVVVTLFTAGVTQAERACDHGNACGNEEVMAATGQVLQTTQDFDISLGVFSRTLRNTSPPNWGVPADALAQAEDDASELMDRMERLESLINPSSRFSARFARRALARAEIRLVILDDALQWFQSTSPPGPDHAVERCDGTFSCFWLRLGCDGCYKSYGDGTAACYEPADDIEGC